MTTKKSTTKKARSNHKTAAKVVGIIGGVTAAALGAYLYSKTSKGKKQISKISTQAEAWVTTAKKDIMKKVKDLKHVSHLEYIGIVNEIMEKYKKIKTVAPKEIQMVKNELKKHWSDAKKEITKNIKEEFQK